MEVRDSESSLFCGEVLAWPKPGQSQGSTSSMGCEAVMWLGSCPARVQGAHQSLHAAVEAGVSHGKPSGTADRRHVPAGGLLLLLWGGEDGARQLGSVNHPGGNHCQGIVVAAVLRQAGRQWGLGPRVHDLAAREVVPRLHVHECELTGHTLCELAHWTALNIDVESPQDEPRQAEIFEADH